jgi:hypothetical protein
MDTYLNVYKGYYVSSVQLSFPPSPPIPHPQH